jgi:hypothetical protein
MSEVPEVELVLELRVKIPAPDQDIFDAAVEEHLDYVEQMLGVRPEVIEANGTEDLFLV